MIFGLSISLFVSLIPFAFVCYKVVDANSSELVHTFTPFRESQDEDGLSTAEPPITKLCTSSDRQWLAAVNCFGDIYVFNLETLRYISNAQNLCFTKSIICFAPIVAREILSCSLIFMMWESFYINMISILQNHLL